MVGTSTLQKLSFSRWTLIRRALYSLRIKIEAVSLSQQLSSVSSAKHRYAPAVEFTPSPGSHWQVHTVTSPKVHLGPNLRDRRNPSLAVTAHPDPIPLKGSYWTHFQKVSRI